MLSFASLAAQPVASADECELAEWRKLRDPVVLHVSLLRGSPAKLDRNTFLHLAGTEPATEPSGSRCLKEDEC